VRLAKSASSIAACPVMRVMRICGLAVPSRRGTEVVTNDGLMRDRPRQANERGGATDEQLVGVLYLIGYASEALQKWNDALAYYERVFAVDITFRDVNDRLAALERVAR
jgi:hypothetical protein